MYHLFREIQILIQANYLILQYRSKSRHSSNDLIEMSGRMSIIRYGRIVKLKTEYMDEYIKYHQSVWPEVLESIKDSGIENYTIFQWGTLLFSYYEIDSKFVRNSAQFLFNDSCMRWEEIMSKMQISVTETKGSSQWTRMAEVFHQD